MSEKTNAEFFREAAASSEDERLQRKLLHAANVFDAGKGHYQHEAFKLYSDVMGQRLKR